MWVWTSTFTANALAAARPRLPGPGRWLQDGAAFLASPTRLVGVEALDHGLELDTEVGDPQRRLVEDRAAPLAVPAERLRLPWLPLALDHQPDRPRPADGAVRDEGREQQHLALADREVPALAVLDDAEDNVALELVEELLARVDVIVVPLVRAADDHDLEVRVLPDHGVADRRREEVAMLVDPGFEVERSQFCHGDPPIRQCGQARGFILLPRAAEFQGSRGRTARSGPAKIPAAQRDRPDRRGGGAVFGRRAHPPKLPPAPGPGPRSDPDLGRFANPRGTQTMTIAAHLCGRGSVGATAWHVPAPTPTLGGAARGRRVGLHARRRRRLTRLSGTGPFPCRRRPEPETRTPRVARPRGM